MKAANRVRLAAFFLHFAFIALVTLVALADGLATINKFLIA